MGYFSGALVFLITWWTVIFCVLPFGLKRDEQGKPENPQLGKKLILTTVITALLWGVFYVLIEKEVVNFRKMAANMHAQELETKNGSPE